ncbi:MAG: methionyl-tRNA formyltransferase, partial [Actinobacteria bacterium]|nr:methionyl-tRNA formyltransferase [Actinomycetota bacterium]
MRVLLAGTPALVLPIFDAVSRSDIEVTGVLTNKPRPRGRSGEPIPTPVKSLGSREVLSRAP